MKLDLTACEPVTSAAHGSAEWHEARRVGIGGSDAGIILGLSDYTTPRQLWALKTGRTQPDKGNAYTRCGQILERAILERAYHGHAYPGDKYGSMRSLERAHMLANIDGVHDGRLVEIKTTGKPWRGEVPEVYVAQVRHYLYVTGLTGADVVECHVKYNREALVAAMDLAGLRPDRVVEHLCTLTVHKIEQDEAWLAAYLDAADAFWAAVQADTWTSESDKDALGW